LQEATVETESIATDSANGSEFPDDIFADEFEKDTVTIPDPLSPVNRAMYYVNDKLYFWILKPIARGYTAITPELFRIGVKNFFRNVTTPIRVANCILQGKANAAAVEFSRFLYNTVVGVLGFGSPADKHPELAAPDAEDFGQTLGVYGFTNGIYIVWPVFGPSTLRDSIGMVGDWFLDPVNYLENTELSYAVKGFDRINETSFRIGEYEALKKASLDPYVALRDVYLQYREKKTKH
jgi:phospholipid-binding lipoprotein MlaA